MASLKAINVSTPLKPRLLIQNIAMLISVNALSEINFNLGWRPVPKWFWQEVGCAYQQCPHNRVWRA